MREIKFRGKKDNDKGEWVYGYLTKTKHDYLIGENQDFMYWVKPETVGQYTGLKDCNGQEIYEGDILYLRVDDRCYEVVWNKCAWELSRKETSILMANLCNAPDGFVFKVVGNIYDNPEKKEG